MNDTNLLDNFKKEIKNYPVLPKDEFLRLMNDYKSSGSIVLRDKIITGNMRYAFVVANSWHNSKGWDLAMCVSIAMEGLITAVDKYELNKRTDKQSISMTTFLKKHLEYAFLNYNVNEAHQIKLSKPDREKPIMISTGATVTHKDYDGTIEDILISDDDFRASDISDSEKIKEMIWNAVKEDCFNRPNVHGIDNQNSFEIIKGRFNEKEMKVTYEDMGLMYGGVSRQSVSQAAKGAFKRLRNNKALQDIYNNKIQYLK